ncbi:hypothetical protein NPIL_652471 [Nephila pilipes]|uniref:RNase H type-1 domain-containing protein n=1 Tax=Nephila pilipes TaxID=299642 RepID=A0A8X6IFA0_NEPPI|nr:hypothetical protein NPIL_652471 [Nephila pilipes]
MQQAFSWCTLGNTKYVTVTATSQCGLRGNDTADFAAKKGTAILQKSCSHLSLHSAKWEIKRIFKPSFHHATSVAADKS